MLKEANNFKPHGIPMNLQLFADDPITPATTPSAAPAPAAVPATQALPGAQAAPAASPAPAPAQAPSPSAVNMPMPGASSTPDTSAEVLSALSALTQSVQGLQSSSNQPTQPTPEELAAKNEALLNELNSNPQAVFDRIRQEAEDNAMAKANEKVNAVVAPLQQKAQQAEWQNQTRRFFASNPRASQYSKVMSQIIQSNPDMTELAKTNPKAALERSHQIAVGQQLAGDGGDIVGGILSNEELKTQIMSNPDIQKQIIDNYVASLNGGPATGLPPVLGNGGSNTTIAPTPQNTPKSMKESKQAALARFAQTNQNNLG